MFLFYCFVWMLHSCFWKPVKSTTKFNGLKDLCDLKLDQVTFAGSHNARSGFNGLLHTMLTLVGIPKTMKLLTVTALEQKGKTALMLDQSKKV